MKHKAKWATIPVLGLILGLSGCGTTSFVAPVHTTMGLINVPRPVPLVACVYVPPNAKQYIYHARIPLGEWTYAFGQDLEQACLFAFRQVFQGVVPVNGPGKHEACDVLIETSFNEGATAVNMSFSQIEVVVGLAFQVSNPGGLLWQRETTGRVTTSGGMESFQEHGKAMAQALTEAAAAMNAEFQTKEFLAKARGRRERGSPAAGRAPDAGGEPPWWKQ